MKPDLKSHIKKFPIRLKRGIKYMYEGSVRPSMHEGTKQPKAVSAMAVSRAITSSNSGRGGKSCNPPLISIVWSRVKMEKVTCCA